MLTYFRVRCSWQNNVSTISHVDLNCSAPIIADENTIKGFIDVLWYTRKVYCLQQDCLSNWQGIVTLTHWTYHVLSDTVPALLLQFHWTPCLIGLSSSEVHGDVIQKWWVITPLGGSMAFANWREKELMASSPKNAPLMVDWELQIKL